MDPGSDCCEFVNYLLNHESFVDLIILSGVGSHHVISMALIPGFDTNVCAVLSNIWQYTSYLSSSDMEFETLEL